MPLCCYVKFEKMKNEKLRQIFLKSRQEIPKKLKPYTSEPFEDPDTRNFGKN